MVWRTSAGYAKFQIQTNINGIGLGTGAEMLTRITDDAAGQAVIDLGSGNSTTFQGASVNYFISSDFEFF